MTYEVKSLNEECGIFGIWGHPQAAQVTYFGLHSLQHRGQEGAGVGVVKLHAHPGEEYVFRERAMGTQAITEVFSKIFSAVEADHIESMSPEEAELRAPFLGEIYGPSPLQHYRETWNKLCPSLPAPKQLAVAQPSDVWQFQHDQC